MNRRIPRDPLPVRPQDLGGLVRQGGVFEPRRGKAFGDPAVERDVRRSGVLIRVEGLEVHDLDRSGRGQLLNELVRPRA